MSPFPEAKTARLSNYQHRTDVTDVIRTSSSYTILNTDYEEAQAATKTACCPNYRRRTDVIDIIRNSFSYIIIKWQTD